MNSNDYNKQQDSFKAKLTEGNIPLQLIKLTIPLILGLISISMINVVDTFFVGQLGTDELAAMSFTFPVVAFMSSILSWSRIFRQKNVIS